MKNISIIKLFLKDLLKDKFFLLFFAVNLSISLSGIIGLENFKMAFRDSINSRAKEIAGADLIISSRRPLDEKKLEEVKNILPVEKMKKKISFFSMGKVGARSKLVRVSAFDRHFPFYGKRQYGPQISGELKTKEVIVYPAILQLFDVKVGDKIKIGRDFYQIVSVVKKDPSETFDMGQIAPSVLLSDEGIKSGGFLDRGSTAFYSSYIKTSNELSNEGKNKVIDLFNDSSVRVRSMEDTSGQVGRVLDYLSDFLGIVSVIALFLSFIGSFYLCSSFFLKKTKIIAIYKALGLRESQIKRGFYFQSFCLSFLSLFFAFSMSIGINKLGEKLIGPYLSEKIFISTSFNGVVAAVLILGLVFFALIRPLIKEILLTSTSEVFQEGGQSSRSFRTKITRTIFLITPFLYLLVFFISRSWILSTGFIVTLSIGVAVVYSVLSTIYRVIPDPKIFEFKMAKRYLSRHKLSTLSIFISIFFGASLINLLPVVEKSINEEISGVKGEELPEYFLFDIQEEQVPSLTKLSEDLKIELQKVSPMVRARLIKINGEELKVSKDKAMTREQERKQRFRNRGVNLSYDHTLGVGEEIIEGAPLEKFQGEEVIPISVEKRYLNRIGAGLGDHLTFDIMGLEFETEIKNVRQIRWTSFRPNFFIKFPVGVLEDTPKTFLASVKVKNQEEQFIDQMSEQLPNVSMVDIREITKKVMGVMAEMGFALRLMSILSIGVGFIIVVSLINHQLIERKKDFGLLNVIGMNYKKLKRMMLAEFLFITGTALSFGIIFGQIIGHVIAYQMFYRSGHVNTEVGLFTLAPILFVTFVTVEISSFIFFKKNRPSF